MQLVTHATLDGIDHRFGERETKVVVTALVLMEEGIRQCSDPRRASLVLDAIDSALYPFDPDLVARTRASLAEPTDT